MGKYRDFFIKSNKIAQNGRSALQCGTGVPRYEANLCFIETIQLEIFDDSD